MKNWYKKQMAKPMDRQLNKLEKLNEDTSAGVVRLSVPAYLELTKHYIQAPIRSAATWAYASVAFSLGGVVAILLGGK